MPFFYTGNVLDMLRDAGYNTNRLRKEKLLSESTIQKLRSNQMISLPQIDVICSLLKCRPCKFIKYANNAEEGERYGHSDEDKTCRNVCENK